MRDPLFVGGWFVVRAVFDTERLTVGWSHVWWEIYDVAGRRITRYELDGDEHGNQPVMTGKGVGRTRTFQ